jgi:CBS domain-containing protein
MKWLKKKVNPHCWGVFCRLKLGNLTCITLINKIMEPENKRDKIAIIILLSSFISIVGISICYGMCNDDWEKIFNSLLPLISTWIGTVLVFYFGKENFEAASKRYEKMIDKLTPEILDDILVKQVMIDKATMLTLTTEDEKIKNFDAKILRDFLDSINKSRLPIIDKEGKIKCIIHKSVFSDEILKPSPAKTLDEFIKNNPIVILFELINENKKIEDAQKIMKDKNHKDLFVINDKNEIVGWLTDTQIIRYMNN